MNTIIAIIIVVILILLYIFWQNITTWQHNIAYKYYQNSIGTFDNNAQIALTQLLKIPNPTATEYLMRGNIYYYNILSGNAQQPNITGINRRNIVYNAISNYTNALETLYEHPQNTNAIHPSFILQQINNVNLDNEYNNDNDNELQHALFNFNHIVNNVTPKINKDIIIDRQQNAINNSATRDAAIENYYNNSTIYTSDAQNVHDNKVNIDLQHVLHAIKSTMPPNSNGDSIINDAEIYINNIYIKDHDNERTNNAKRTLDKIKENNFISTFNDNECNIFTYVWQRSNHPDNTHNCNLIKNAIIDALADSVENNNLVCINGRTCRVLNSLVTLDYNNIVSRGAMTYEAYKNQIFNETRNIINEYIENAKNNANEDIRNVAKSYVDTTIITKRDIELEFQNNIKKLININLDKYKLKFSDIELEKIRNECYAGVDI